MAGAAEGKGRADQRLNEEELRFALESGQLGTWSLDRASSELTTSPTCRKNFGRDPERPFTYDELRAAVHPQDRDRMVSAVRDSLETGCDCDIVYRVITPAGEVRWLGIRARVSHLANGGAVRLAGVSQDITAQRQADRMRVALVALGDALRDLDDAAAIAHTAGRILGETLDIDRAGYGTVDPVEETITIERDWNAPGVESLAGTLHFRDYGHYVEDLVRGETVAFADAEVDPRTRANAAALEAINARAVVNMPVTERGRTVALFYLNHGAARVWTPAELAFLREVAERTRASSERRRAEVAVRASARRLAFLDALGRDSAEATDADAILALTTRRLGEYLGVSIAAYADMEDDQDAFTIRGDWAAPGSASIVGRYRLAAFGARAVRELGAGEPLIIHDNLVELPPEEAATFQAIGITATICMPLVKEGRLAALMAIHDKAPRVWSAEELALLREVTERSWAHVERVGAVSELRASEARLRVLNAELEQRVIERSRSRGRTWQVSPELLGVAGLDGHLEEVNPAWRTVLDWPADELLGRDVAQFVHPDDAAATGAVYDQLRDPVPPAVLRVDNRCRCRDGSYRWLSWLIVPDDGRLYLSARDVTEQKEAAQALAQAQASLRQSQKMEAVGQLTGGLAHDFNNLLAGISGSLEMMNTRISQGRLDAVERYFMAARGAVKRAAALTHRLLAFSRRQTLDPKPTDVNRLVSGMEELVRRTVGPSIELEVVGAAAVWPTLVDQNQLENALLNLCINARDAMPHGGRLTIETANRWLDERAAQSHDLAPGQYVSLSVTDTGTGMAPDVIAKAFDPFFTTKPLGEGTGLGLSMVYGFARQSGGQVRVYSELGSGTTMCVYLPRGATDAQAAAVEAPAPNPETTGKGETVLVVDDEPTIRMLVGEVLADGGYTAIEASDGPAALRILQSSVRIDLLITDVGLPGGLNGRQVADAAREARPGLHVIFITGYAENAALGGGYLERGMSLITKPFEIDTLARKIREAFDAARASRPGEASR